MFPFMSDPWVISIVGGIIVLFLGWLGKRVLRAPERADGAQRHHSIKASGEASLDAERIIIGDESDTRATVHDTHSHSLTLQDGAKVHAIKDLIVGDSNRQGEPK